MQAKVPMYTLHKNIHQTINSIPVPNEDVCEYVWHEIEALRIAGLINAEKDNPEQKLYVIIELLKHYDTNLEVTLATLSWQKTVIHKFYQAPH